jgi:hypothetical protein
MDNNNNNNLIVVKCNGDKTSKTPVSNNERILTRIEFYPMAMLRIPTLNINNSVL